MAGLTKDKRTGYYIAQFHDADRTPTRKRVSTRVRNKRAAERLRRLWEAAYAEGSYDPWTDRPPVAHEEAPARAVTTVTLASSRDAFLASRSHLALNTRLNYDRVVGRFVAYAGEGRPVGGVTARDVERWVGGLVVRPVTRANYVRHLRAYFRYCKGQGWTRRDPTEDVRLERVPRRFPKALRPEQVEAVARYAEAHCRDGDQRSSAWAAPFIRLGAETALRRNELLNLRWDHVDLDVGHLTVACTDAFTSKSGAERRVPLSAKAVAVLRDWRRRPSATGLVLEAGSGPVDPATCSKTVKRFAVAAGVPELTPHVLRHSCLTWLVERGVPVPVVQRFAGHADVATTMLYCSVADDVAGDRIRSALDGG